ncbi:unnamed protein product [Somion occarium]|uniref:Uncharacterized protein n=1 Tax=Somion occarium TaxID=3059160 RepID=A0ABP1DVL5_9APHY
MESSPPPLPAYKTLEQLNALSPDDYAKYMVATLGWFQYYAQLGTMQLQAMVPDDAEGTATSHQQLASTWHLDPAVFPDTPEKRQLFFETCVAGCQQSIVSPVDAVRCTFFARPAIQILTSEASHHYPANEDEDEGSTSVASITRRAEELADRHLGTSGAAVIAYTNYESDSESEPDSGRFRDLVDHYFGTMFRYRDEETDQLAECTIDNMARDVFNEEWFWLIQKVGNEAPQTNIVKAETLEDIFANRIRKA